MVVLDIVVFCGISWSGDDHVIFAIGLVERIVHQRHVGEVVVGGGKVEEAGGLEEFDSAFWEHLGRSIELWLGVLSLSFCGVSFGFSLVAK